MRLLLIEGSQRLRRSLTSAFLRAGLEIDSVQNGELGLSLSERNHPDVVLLDMEPCGADGFELVSRLRKNGKAARIILLIPGHSVEDCVRGLYSGADDCLPKPFSFVELLARVRALTRRRRRFGSSRIRIDDLLIDTAARRVTRDGVAVRLTRREFQILELLAQRRGETVSRLEIESHLYGEDFPLSNAVASAICLIRKKLGVDRSGRNLVHTKRGRGYSLGIAES